MSLYSALRNIQKLVSILLFCTIGILLRICIDASVKFVFQKYGRKSALILQLVFSIIFDKYMLQVSGSRGHYAFGKFEQ